MHLLLQQGKPGLGGLKQSRSHCKGMLFRPGSHSPHSRDSSYFLTTEKGFNLNLSIPAGAREVIRLFDGETAGI